MLRKRCRAAVGVRRWAMPRAPGEIAPRLPMSGSSIVAWNENWMHACRAAQCRWTGVEPGPSYAGLKRRLRRHPPPSSCARNLRLCAGGCSSYPWTTCRPQDWSRPYQFYAACLGQPSGAPAPTNSRAGRSGRDARPREARGSNSRARKALAKAFYRQLREKGVLPRGGPHLRSRFSATRSEPPSLELRGRTVDCLQRACRRCEASSQVQEAREWYNYVTAQQPSHLQAGLSTREWRKSAERKHGAVD